jgi:hypothetical protein
MAGFYKNGCQEKTLLPVVEHSDFFCVQPLLVMLRVGVGSSLGSWPTIA